jgi:hypothetical protein
MPEVLVRPFQRRDREQATELVNAHISAALPGVSVSVNAVMSQLEREHGRALRRRHVTAVPLLLRDPRPLAAPEGAGRPQRLSPRGAERGDPRQRRGERVGFVLLSTDLTNRGTRSRLAGWGEIDTLLIDERHRRRASRPGSGTPPTGCGSAAATG